MLREIVKWVIKRFTANRLLVNPMPWTIVVLGLITGTYCTAVLCGITLHATRIAVFSYNPSFYAQARCARIAVLTHIKLFTAYRYSARARTHTHTHTHAHAMQVL